MTAPIIVLISPAEDVLDAPRIQSGVLKALSDSANFLAIAPFRAGDKALAGETGKIVETWYGSDAGDRIPMERIELFAARGLLS